MNATTQFPDRRLERHDKNDSPRTVVISPLLLEWLFALMPVIVGCRISVMLEQI